MRILHLTDRLTLRGGAHRHLLAVLARLARTDEVRLAAGADDGAAAPCPVDVLPGLEARGPRPVPGLDALLGRADLVHVHTVVNPWVLARVAERGRALITVQDHRYFCPGRGKLTAAGAVCREPASPAACAPCFSDEAYFAEVRGLTEARLLAVRRMAAVVVLSRYMAGELAAAGVDPARVHVVPPFVDGIDPAAEPDGPPCVLFVGRLAEAKGVRDALGAWRRAETGLPLVLAGTGPLRAELEAAGAAVLGWRPPADLSRTYRRARALLLPSRWQEPFGIAGLEALACGVPVAAWDSGGVREWHPGGPLLVPWGDVEALGRALRAAPGHPAAPAPGFAPEALMARLRQVYGTLA